MDWSSIIGGFGSGGLQALTGQPQGGGPTSPQTGQVPGYIPKLVNAIKNRKRRRYQPMGPTDQQLGYDPNADSQYGVPSSQSPQYGGWNQEDM